MVRSIACLAVALLMAAPLWAGELDGEYRGKAPAAPAARDVVRPLNRAAASWPMLTGEARADARKVSELDRESPAQSCRWRCRGWGGCCFSGCGWGCCSPCWDWSCCLPCCGWGGCGLRVCAPFVSLCLGGVPGWGGWCW